MIEYMKRPTYWFCRMCNVDHSDEMFQKGRIAMALEVLTVVRTIEAIPSMMRPDQSDAVVSVLMTLLDDQGLRSVSGLYDQLSAARRPTFVSSPEQPASDGVEHSGLTVEPFGFVSRPVEPQDTLSPQAATRALLEAHRNQDASPTAASEESHGGEDETTPNG